MNSAERKDFVKEIAKEIEGNLVDKNLNETLKQEEAAMEPYYREDLELDQRDQKHLILVAAVCKDRLNTTRRNLENAKRRSGEAVVKRKNEDVIIAKDLWKEAVWTHKFYKTTKQERVEEYTALRKRGDNTLKSKKVILAKYVALAEKNPGEKFNAWRRQFVEEE